jgi:hypothetical protein
LDANCPLVFAVDSDIELGHDYPLGRAPFFNMLQRDLFSPSDPKTNTAGDSLTLTVEKLP